MMNTNLCLPLLASITVIVNSGLSQKVKKIASKKGALGFTIVLCKGTVKNKLLDLLGIGDNRRELIFILCERYMAIEIINEIGKELDFHKNYTGIAFSTDISDVMGAHTLSKVNCNEISDFEYEKKEEQIMYNAIYVVVDKGRANEVIEISEKLGILGGTIFNARGSGIHETSKLFHMDVEPEKEVVLIITNESQTQKIAEGIVDSLELNTPGNGLLYIQKIDNVIGLF